MTAPHQAHTDTRALQLRLLDILKTIHQVCSEHGLTYYLLAGSCLGAVRHQGFIPWDDDADVGLPRRDYDLLVAHAKEWLPEGFELFDGTRNPRYPYPFARIQDARTTYLLRRQFDFVGGLPVDVYPLDGMTAHHLKRRWHYLRYSLTKKLLYFCLVDPYKHGHGLRSMLPLTVRRLFDPAALHRRLDCIQREYSTEASVLLVDHDYGADKGILPASVYGTPQQVMFEGTPLCTVAQTDAYLRHLYGDYMKLPDRLPPQNFRLLDLDCPYREFNGKS